MLSILSREVEAYLLHWEATASHPKKLQNCSSKGINTPPFPPPVPDCVCGKEEQGEIRISNKSKGCRVRCLTVEVCQSNLGKRSLARGWMPMQACQILGSHLVILKKLLVKTQENKALILLFMTHAHPVHLPQGCWPRRPTSRLQVGAWVQQPSNDAARNTS